MKKNFSIISSIEVVKAGDSFDLHNDFDLSKLEIDFQKNNLSLLWLSRSSSSCLQLSIVFKQIKYFNALGFDEEMPRAEDRRLSFLGYLHPEDVNIMNGFLPEESYADGHHIIFSFEGGLTLKLLAEIAELDVKN